MSNGLNFPTHNGHSRSRVCVCNFYNILLHVIGLFVNLFTHGEATSREMSLRGVQPYTLSIDQVMIDSRWSVGLLLSYRCMCREWLGTVNTVRCVSGLRHSCLNEWRIR